MLFIQQQVEFQEQKIVMSDIFSTVGQKERERKSGERVRERQKGQRESQKGQIETEKKRQREKERNKEHGMVGEGGAVKKSKKIENKRKKERQKLRTRQTDIQRENNKHFERVLSTIVPVQIKKSSFTSNISDLQLNIIINFVFR